MNIHLTDSRTWRPIALLLTLLPLLQSCQATEVSPAALGILAFKDEVRPERTCKIPMESKIVLRDDNNFGGCGFTWISTLWLENAHSAVTIEFVDNGDNCKDHSAPRHSIIVKTTAFDNTPYNFTFSDMLQAAPNEIIVPGLRLLAKTTKHNGPTMNRNVGCIIITPSD